MSPLTAEPVVMAGEIGIPQSRLLAGDRSYHEERLTLTTVPWDENDAPVEVQCFRDEAGKFWIPRYYAHQALWPQVGKWTWTEGRAFDFDLSRARLDPERGQDQAVPAMLAHINKHSSGVLVSGTGTGKTFMGLYVAAKFGRFIAAPVYNGHMVDNWMEHATEVLGLSEDQVGLVQEERCDLGRPVTIMMIQSLLSRRYPDELYEQIGFLLADEVHRYGAPQWMKVARMFPARYRMGLSADPRRKDGLDRIVQWTFGDVGHTAKRVRTENTQTPSVTLVRYQRCYAIEGYCKWERDENGEWVPGEGHPTKYAKMIANDRFRSAMIATEIVNAAERGRQILVFSTIVKHLEVLEELTLAELARRKLPYTVGRLKAKKGKSTEKAKAERAKVFASDIRFCTYAMGRDAMNIPQLDTLFFATPPGNPLQPIGRLREVDEGFDRKDLVVVDIYDDTDYGRERMYGRRHKYTKLGMDLDYVERPGPPKKAKK